jgi:molecular chaperone DnaJ
VDLGTDDAFAELGLPSDATESEVKAAWRRLVSQWHPDRNDSSTAVAKMQRINQAFKAIRRSGQHAAETDPNAPEAGDDEAGTASATSSSDPPRRPIHRKIRLTLEEAAAGCIKVLRGKIIDVCTTCAGAGHQVLGGNCAQCGGSGAIPTRSFFGWPGRSIECEACLGGGIARQTCPTCGGAGKAATHSYSIKVRIPHGVRHGDLLHVEGRRPGRPPADLEIRIEIIEHAFFELHDNGTIRCEMPVDGFAWIANRLVQVPTLGGLQPLRLSRDQLSYRLKGQGFPVERRGARGDQLVAVVPVFPAELSTDQEILLDQLIATSAKAAAQGRDDRLGAWNQGLRAWERSQSGRAP